MLKSVTTEEMIYDAYSRVSVNAARIHAHDGDVSATVVYIDFSLLNHCCVPNCEDRSVGSDMLIVALRDIEVGELLCISYIRDVHRLLSGKFRREKLMEVFGFDCMCSVCMEEREIGSYRWFLDQQKSSFITPWSFKVADLAMKDGKNALMKLIQLKEDEDWASVMKVTEAALIRHKGVLSEKNIIPYLLSTTLLDVCLSLGQPARKGLEVAELVMKSVEEYEMPNSAQGILSKISILHFTEGNLEMGKEIQEKSSKLFPLKLSSQCRTVSKGSEMHVFLTVNADESSDGKEIEVEKMLKDLIEKNNLRCIQ